jgi:hypothetical protein
MKVFQIRARSLDDPRPDAGAIVVAENADEAMILLRKDINFAGYALPPAEMAPVSIDTEEVRRVLGEDAAHEKGVYGFRLIGAETPPLPSD